jgi:hypothetical protein
MNSNELNKKLNFIIYGALIAAFVIIILTTYAEGRIAFNAFTGSYMVLLISVIFILAITLKKIANLGIYESLIALAPIILLMLLISWILVILYKYSDRIIGHKVSDYYVTFMNISTILILVQLTIIMKSVTDNNLGKQLFQPKILAIWTLLFTINMIIVITLGVILKSYVTDG